MNRLELLHLTYASLGKAPQSIEFGPRLSVIHGASDTGKSYIVDAIDYLLGSKEIRDIPEARGYTHFLLGLRLGGERDVTLMRDAENNKVWLYEGDVRDVPSQLPVAQYGTKHSATSDANISRFLLGAMQLDGRKAQKNQAGATVSISFRNVSHLAIVGETKMQSEKSPVLNEIPTAWTSDRSTFRVLLSGEDDSHLSPPVPLQQQKITKGKAQVFDRILEELSRTVASDPDRGELLDQRARLASTLQQQELQVVQLLEMRDQALSRREAVSNAATSVRRRMEEADDLLGRLGLLRKQYQSDLDRLEMVRQAGSLLGFYESTTCPFCGAPLEHQDRRHHSVGEARAFIEGIDAESAKVTTLAVDLSATLDDLASQRESLSVELNQAAADLAHAGRDVLAAEEQLRPQRDELTTLTDAVARVARGLSVHEQIASIEALRASLIVPEVTTAAPTVQRIESNASRDFAETVKRILASWRVPEAASIYLDDDTSDLIVGGRKRDSRGKGMRAILHAAFTVGLAEYCIEHDLPHPGFVVLDSPVVTYREPDPDETSAQTELGDAVIGEDLVSHSVADAFFLYLQDDFPGQAVVIENVRPPMNLADSSVNIKFSKNRTSGRYGFLPPI